MASFGQALRASKSARIDSHWQARAEDGSDMECVVKRNASPGINLYWLLFFRNGKAFYAKQATPAVFRNKHLPGLKRLWQQMA